MPSPIASLAGVPLGGASDYQWSLRAGVAPAEVDWVVTENTWKQLETFAGISAESPGLTYQVTVNGADVQPPTRGLFILWASEGPTSHTRTLRIVDRRWLWQHIPVASSYNVTWTVGENVIVAEGQNPETPDLVPTVQYKKPSLRGETTAWTAHEVLSDVVSKVTGVPPIFDGNFDGQPVDDLVIDLPGHLAIQTVLAYFPGAEIYLDHDGVAHVKDTLDGSEVGVLARLLPHATQVSARLIDKKFVRPRRIDVLFTCEFDTRFDYSEAPSGTITNSEDTNRLENVAQVTESTGQEIDGITYGPGSWVAMPDLFTAWGRGPGERLSGGPARVLSYDIMRLHVASNFRYLAPEFLYRGALIDPQWARRIASATHSYRRTFRIAREFMQRLASVKPVRASVIAPNTGARASSPVYSDYTMRPSHKGFVLANASEAPSGVAVRGYAQLLTASDVTPAPVKLQIVDPSAGVFQLIPKQTDTRGFYDSVFLGYPDVGATDGTNPFSGLPVQALGGRGGASGLVKAAFEAGWDHVDFEADWNFATIMSVVPNSPNDISRFYKVEITPDEEALGPPMTVRVYPGVVTARFAWDDAEADVIVGKIRGDTTEFPSQLVNRRHVEDVAQAVADATLARFKDRVSGSLNVDSRIAGAQLPVGLVSRVTQQMAGGAARTAVEFGDVAQQLDFWRFLPSSTQRALLRSQLTLADPMAQSFGF